MQKTVQWENKNLRLNILGSSDKNISLKNGNYLNSIRWNVIIKSDSIIKELNALQYNLIYSKI